MEINVQALAQGLPARFFGWLSAVASDKQYHGFQCGVGRIIESPADCDKRSFKKQGSGVRDQGSASFFNRIWSLSRAKKLFCPLFSVPRIGCSHSRIFD
jgi:hypothetical protein